MEKIRRNKKKVNILSFIPTIKVGIKLYLKKDLGHLYRKVSAYLKADAKD